MAADDPQVRPPEQLSSSPLRVGMRKAVEAVAAKPIAAAPTSRKRVGASRRWQGRMEGGVEAGHCGHIWQRLRYSVQCRQRLGLMERRQIGELSQRLDDCLVDPHRLTEALAAVDDAVADGIRSGEAADCVADLRLIELAAIQRQVR